MGAPGYVVGVDLGTTFTAAAVVAKAGHARICQLGTASAAIPSVVVLRADGEVLVGEAAARRAVAEPTRAAREFKRRLGDSASLVLGGTPYSADALLGRLLRVVLEHVATEEGAPPEVVCLTHPANWGSYKLDLLHEACRVAGLTQPWLLTEPQAAAVHYALEHRLEPRDHLAVYDLGGGTFDAAVVRSNDAGFELVGTPEGIERFGGIDLDQAVFDHVAGVLGEAFDEVDSGDRATIEALANLREACQRAKETLSSDTDATIPVFLPNLHTQVRLTRAEFEDLIRPRIRDTLEVLDRVVASAGISMEEVSRTLMIGGSSRIPLVGEMVASVTGRPIALDANPKHAVALGAAAWAWERRIGGVPATTIGAAAISGHDPDDGGAVSVGDGDRVERVIEKATGRRWRLVAAAVAALTVGGAVTALASGALEAFVDSGDVGENRGELAADPSDSGPDADDPASYYTTDATEPALLPECNGALGLCMGDSLERVFAVVGVEDEQWEDPERWLSRQWHLAGFRLTVEQRMSEIHGTYEADRIETIEAITIAIGEEALAEGRLRVGIGAGWPLQPRHLQLGVATMSDVVAEFGEPHDVSTDVAGGLWFHTYAYRSGPELAGRGEFTHATAEGDLSQIELASRPVTSFTVRYSRAAEREPGDEPNQPVDGESYVPVSDDSRALSVDVPASWSDVDGAPRDDVGAALRVSPGPIAWDHRAGAGPLLRRVVVAHFL